MLKKKKARHSKRVPPSEVETKGSLWVKKSSRDNALVQQTCQCEVMSDTEIANDLRQNKIEA